MQQVPNNGNLLLLSVVAAAHTKRADPSPCLASCIHVTKSPECQPVPALLVSAARSCSPLGKGWHAPISHLRDMKSFAKLCLTLLTWLGPVFPPISFLTGPINFGGGVAGVLAVGSWLVPSWAMLPNSAISLCPALGTATLAQKEKQWPLEHVQGQNLGNEMEAMS